MKTKLGNYINKLQCNLLDFNVNTLDSPRDDEVGRKVKDEWEVIDERGF